MDQYLVYGEDYKTVREAVAKAVIEGRTQSIDEAGKVFIYLFPPFFGLFLFIPRHGTVALISYTVYLFIYRHVLQNERPFISFWPFSKKLPVYFKQPTQSSIPSQGFEVFVFNLQIVSSAENLAHS